MYADCADFVFQTLQVTPDVTDLVVCGEDGIFEAGDLDTSLISQFEEKRRKDDTPELVLAIVVRDAGEETQGDLRSTQQVAIYIYDRQRGYTNIRTLRQQVYLALQSKSCRLDSPLLGRGAMIQLHLKERTGYIHERNLDMDFEVLLMESVVTYDQP